MSPNGRFTRHAQQFLHRSKTHKKYTKESKKTDINLQMIEFDASAEYVVIHADEMRKM